MISIADVGLAAALAKKLATLNPDLDAEAILHLEKKSAKTMQRRKEKRAHEKNLAKNRKKLQLKQLEHATKTAEGQSTVKRKIVEMRKPDEAKKPYEDKKTYKGKKTYEGKKPFGSKTSFAGKKH